MTVCYRCDGPDCDRSMARDEGRLALTLEEPSPPPSDVVDDVAYVESFSYYQDGDFHFCSDSCLTSWAMVRALDDENA